ncbi:MULTISPECIES: FtsX-like permease family protein [unclassified Bacillus (in: firmicutes)]|uniref:FtsX-like permease family protein n=1 Tax=unclassified Bacillus (in: firmicutes) TaxID=185979 RepID=UPI0008ED05A5|nr:MULTISPECIES: ABC transporter permease [unclassified Bacillus (in: firmicutes)]SFA88701.1 putative ABC transport system permease protein [Bacillus sp. UNCCL13]SFQ84675.1 putative ABC transport system permease protein [Bacillus sp. cl95]
MTLTDIAKKNIRKNLKDYYLYVNSMIISILIFFTFKSLQYNQNLLDSLGTVDKVESALNAASFVLILFAAVFIFYSNAFFTRKRKKEIGLYALFGMPKERIAVLLFFENLIIGSIALFIGIIGGIFLSKLFTMIILKLMGVKVIVGLSFSLRALIFTSVLFLIITLISSVQSYRLIYRFSLSELFQADRKGERVLFPSVIKSVLGVLLISIGYWLVLDSDATALGLTGGAKILVCVISLIVGTYLFLSTTVLFFLQILKKEKGTYYRGSNLISISQILYRIKSNVVMLTIITILSTFTLFAMSTSYNLYYQTNKISDEQFPVSYVIKGNEETKNEIKNLINSYPQHKVLYELKMEYLSVKADVSKIGRVPEWFQTILISEKTFKNMLDARDIHMDLKLDNNDAIAFYDGNLDVHADPYTNKNVKIIDNGENLKIKAYKSFTLLNQGQYFFPLVVSNDFYSSVEKEIPASTAFLFKIKNQKDSESLSEKIDARMLEKTLSEEPYLYSNFFNGYQKLKETYGLLIFLSGFLGLVFLLATGSMIFFKQLTEANADQDRFVIMTKLGMKPKDLRKSIRLQILLVFLLPLVIAILHSAVLINALSNFIGMSATIPFLTSVCAYVAIYFGYYVLTVQNYLKILQQRRN